MREAVRRLTVYCLCYAIRLMRLLGVISQRTGRVGVVVPAAPGSLGDSALTQSIAQGLRSRGDKELVILAPASGIDASEYGVSNAETISFDGRGLALLCWLYQMSRCYKIYIIGADVMDGAYSRSSVQRCLLARIGVALGISTHIVSMSFSDTPSDEVCREFASMPASVRITCRDQVSGDRLARIANGEVQVGADLAFLLEPDFTPAIQETLNWINDYRCSQEEKLAVGININRLTIESDRLDEMIMAYARVIRWGTINSRVGFVLLPHDYRTHQDDEGLLKQVAEKAISLGAPASLIRSTPVPISAAETKAICRHLDFAITGRMHLGIACLSQGVPAACLSYQGKVDGLMRHLDTPELRLDPCSILETEVFASQFASLLNHRYSLTERIRQNLPEVKAIAELNFHDRPVVSCST